MQKGFLRILTLILSLMLCISTVPALALEEGEEIPLQNAGFEEATDAENPGWEYMKGAEFTVETTANRVRTGKKSLKINNVVGNNPWAMQVATGFTPGAMYELGAWLNTDLADPNGNGVGFKIEQYDAAGAGIPEYDMSGTKLRLNTLGQWNYHSIFFQAAPNVHTVRVYLRSYTPGIVWYDDVSIKLSGGPEPYSFYADHVFHYPDEESGSAFVRLDSYYAADSPESTDVSARFTFLDGATVLDKKENVKIADGVAKYTYPVSLMKEKQKQYVLKTELLDKNGEVIREWSQNMYVYDRPLWFQDGRWTYNGEQFDPIIAYHVSTGHVETLPEGTFNTFQVGYGYTSAKMDNAREAYLASLDKAGKKALLCLYAGMKAAGHPDNIETTRRLVEMYKDDPRVFAWAVQDEPLGAGVTGENKKWLEESYKAIRDIDPNHPVYLLDYNNHEETIKYGDVFVADVYAHGTSAVSVSKIIEPLTERFSRIPTYELAACYKQNGVFPSMTVARASVYRGFAAGNSYGTGFYAISDAMGHDAGDTKASLETLEVWPQYKTLLSEECPILFAYYAGEAGKDFTSFNKERAGELYKELLWETWFTRDGEMYLLAHNRSAEEAEFNIPLVSKNGKIRVGAYTAEPIGLTATGEKNGEGSISFTLGQEEVALYKINPAEKVDLTNIDAPSFDDLAGYEWAQAAIVETQTNGIINSKGESTYAPGENITRGDFAGYLIRTLGFTSDSTENFADVPAEREYAKEIAAGRALGILNGIGDNLFSPEAPITRQDVMTICARGMKMAEKLAAADPSVLDAFADKDSIADYALESVSAMVVSGIVQGDGTGLNPLGNTTRAEAAVIMQRILHAKKVENAIPSEPTVENEVIEFAAPSEDALAKYNRSIDLLKGLGTPAITPETSITNGEAEAVLSAILGYAYDGFGENHLALTTQSAAEAFVKLLGYEAYTASDGGFMAVASRLELLKGVDTAQEYLRGGEFAVMTENALGIYLVDRAGYGGEAEGMYVETEDTLLARYRHLTLYKGILEQNENTGLQKGKVAVGTTLLDAGESDAKNFIGQRVEVYTEGEDNTIVYIRKNKNVVVTTVDAGKIVRGETDMNRFVYEDENGHTKSVTISGAQVLYNGKYKTNATVDTITPVQGAVTLIKNTGSGAAYILVEAYNNYVVERIWAEDMQIFFKNRSADADGDGTPDSFILWDENDSKKRLSMEGGSFDTLKEWNVVSLYESEDGTVMRAVVGGETVIGTATELGTDEAVIGDATYKIAENSFGSPTLGKEYTYLLDAAGRIAGVNDETVTKNYAYLTSIAQKKGVNKTVQMRVFTKESEMKVMDVKNTVKYNGTPIPSTDLLTKPELVTGEITKDQLIVMETAGDVITGFETAKDGSGMSDAERYNTFTYDLNTENSYYKAGYHGYAARTIASKYIVDEDIVLFIVPMVTSDNISDYSVRNFASFVHGTKYYNATLYDVDEDLYIGAMVQKIENITSVGTNGTTGVISGLGIGLNEATGETIKTVEVMGRSEKTLKFQSDEFKIVLGSKALTDLNKGETEYTENRKGVKTISETMLPSALNVGDVVMYTLKEGTTDVISGMRVLLRAKSPLKYEYSQEGKSEFYNYSQLTYAYAPVDRLVERGFLITPQEYERLYLFEGNGGEAPVFLVEDNEVKRVTPQHIVAGDMVYVQKNNPYQTITVIYR